MGNGGALVWPAAAEYTLLKLNLQIRKHRTLLYAYMEMYEYPGWLNMEYFWFWYVILNCFKWNYISCLFIW